MIDKDVILNIYRHSKGLSQAAERLARSTGAVKCPLCQQIHDMGTPHPSREGSSGAKVEYRVLKRK
jgi:hypothetical protein